MKYSTNLKLRKPEYNDPADINDINFNMDKIDEDLTSHLAESANKAHGGFKGALRRTPETYSISNESDFFPRWDAVFYDTAGFTSGAVTRLTVPAGVSRVKLKCSFFLTNISPTGLVRVTIMKNMSMASGLPQYEIRNPGVTIVNTIESATIDVVQGDYFTVRFHQATGSSINLVDDPRTWFYMEVVE